MHRTRSLRGFTVIELLVVMSVLAVLASFLFPVIGGAVHNSRTAICSNNERQIVRAMMMWTSDNSGVMPTPGQAWSMDGVGVADFNIGGIWPYIAPSVETRAQVLHCPDDAFENMPTYGGTPSFCYRNFTYSLNLQTNNQIQLQQVKHPDAHVWLYEEFAPNDQYCYGPTDVDDWLTGRHGPNGAATASRSQYTDSAWRASGAGNVGYFDGHVSLMTVETYFSAELSHGVPTPYYEYGPLNQ